MNVLPAPSETTPRTGGGQARRRGGALLVALLLAGAPLLAQGGTAAADTRPPSGTPATFSADPLPTVQVDGVVWAQVTVGDTVYATGQFSHARPAGTAVGDPAEVVRRNLLAYDITTGKLIETFDHALNGTGRAIAASPDGTRLYVGGDFTSVDGAARSRVAGIDTATGQLVGGFATGTGAGVKALAANNTNVYVGGTSGKMTAYSRQGALVTSWKPSADREVSAMLMMPDQKKIIIGGPFGKVNGSTRYATAALTAATGAVTTWASSSSSFPIRDQVKAGAPAGSGAGVTSLSTDGTYVFLTSFAYVDRKYQDGTFEGRAALSPADGKLVWLSDCHGDSYSSFPTGGVLYSVGHAHDCGPAGAFPETSPRTWHRALAETTAATGKNGAGTGGYISFQGQPRPTQLAWYPQQSTGVFTGKNQAGWSVTGNARYLSVGGEFRTTDGKAQQGLVRYAVTSLAPNTTGPRAYTGFAVTASGQTVSFPTTWDADNASLTYTVFRDGGTTAVHTVTVSTRFWQLPRRTFTDTGVPTASGHKYVVVVTDPLGNVLRSPSSTVQ